MAFHSVNKGSNNQRTRSFGNRAEQPNNEQHQDNLDNNGREKPTAYINLYLPLENGERVKIGDSGIPLRTDRAGENAILDLIDQGMTVEVLAQLLVMEIGRPRDPNKPLAVDMSRVEHLIQYEDEETPE